MKKYIYTLIVLVILTPLGLLASGTAWGEWGSDEISEIAGFTPNGMLHFPISWGGIMPDYSIPGIGDSLAQQASAYILSAVIGILLILILFTIFKTILPAHK